MEMQKCLESERIPYFWNFDHSSPGVDKGPAEGQGAPSYIISSRLILHRKMAGLRNCKSR